MKNGTIAKFILVLSLGWTNITWSDYTLPQVSAGRDFTVGLRSDGTVVAVGRGQYRQTEVASWNEIVQVSAGWAHTVGLKADGTVVATGFNDYGQCDVSEWTGIVDVQAGGNHTLGLKADGTVVAVGRNGNGQCDVTSWTGITKIAAGKNHSAGILLDGTVVATGLNHYGQCDVGDWTEIEQIALGESHSAGLKLDGTVITAGSYGTNPCGMDSWSNVVHIDAHGLHTVALLSDGSILTDGANYWGNFINEPEWSDIVQIAVGQWHIVALKHDGTVLAEGQFWEGQLYVGSWVDITSVCVGESGTMGATIDGSVVAVGKGQNIGHPRYFKDEIGIIQVDSGYYDFLGLRTDGTAFATHGATWAYNWDVSSWIDIQQIAAGDYHAVGLTNLGTVVTTGSNELGPRNVEDWTDIIQVDASRFITVGLKADGTVIGAGWNLHGQLNFETWNNIIQVSAGPEHVLGLREDGTVIGAGNQYRFPDVSNWTDIVQVCAGWDASFGLKSDGTVVSTGYVDRHYNNVTDWTNIIYICSTWYHTVGLRSDGTVIGVGGVGYSAQNFFDWRLGPYVLNNPPIADAGPDICAEATGEFTLVHMDGSGSYDPDGDPLDYEWSPSDIFGVTIYPTPEAPAGEFPIGPSLVTLTVTDGKGGLDCDDVLVTILDTTPPVLICTTDVIALWPPKHQMADVLITVEVSDFVTSSENLNLVCWITSSEPDDGTGDGSSIGDVNGQDGYTEAVMIPLTYNNGYFVAPVQLRAERDGCDRGREYTIVCEVTDDAGNTATASCVVVVPHDKRKK